LLSVLKGRGNAYFRLRTVAQKFAEIKACEAATVEQGTADAQSPNRGKPPLEERHCSSNGRTESAVVAPPERLVWDHGQLLR
jgi:hypothetical protein